MAYNPDDYTKWLGLADQFRNAPQAGIQPVGTFQPVNATQARTDGSTNIVAPLAANTSVQETASAPQPTQPTTRPNQINTANFDASWALPFSDKPDLQQAVLRILAGNPSAVDALIFQRNGFARIGSAVHEFVNGRLNAQGLNLTTMEDLTDTVRAWAPPGQTPAPAPTSPPGSVNPMPKDTKELPPGNTVVNGVPSRWDPTLKKWVPISPHLRNRGPSIPSNDPNSPGAVANRAFIGSPGAASNFSFQSTGPRTGIGFVPPGQRQPQQPRPFPPTDSYSDFFRSPRGQAVLQNIMNAIRGRRGQ